MTIRIGTAPVSWGVMEVQTSWGRTQTCESVLDEMVSAGYSGTELGPWGFLPTDSKLVMSELTRRHMGLIGAFVPMAFLPSEVSEMPSVRKVRREYEDALTKERIFVTSRKS